MKKAVLLCAVLFSCAVAGCDPAVRIISPQDGASFTAGGTITFVCTAWDAEDGELSEEAIVWTSSIDGEIGTGISCTTDALSPGEHEITVTVTDSAGGYAADGITITISADDAATTTTTAPDTTAATYYVAPDGSDSNPGTEAEPWKTITKAADTLVAGERVYIKAGTYKEQVIPQNSGSQAAYIIYAAYPGDTVTIDGETVALPPFGEYGDLAGLFDIRNKSYIKVDALRIVNATTDEGSNGILVNDADHITISNCSIDTTQASGIGVWGSSDILLEGNEVVRACFGGQQESISVAGTDRLEVKNNIVHDADTAADKEGICIKDGSANGKVYGNVIYNVPAAGIYIDAWDKHTYNIEVFANIVHDISNSDGFQAASEMGGLLESIHFYNNIGYSNKFTGLAVTRNGDEGGPHPMRDIKIINNTFYNNGEAWGGGVAMDNPEAEGIVIRNNICSQNRSFEISVSNDVPAPNVTVENNVLYSYKSDAEDGEVTGIDFIDENPLFIDAAGGDFHVRKNSPAIDTGSAVDAPAHDFDGNARPAGQGYDIGAFEYMEE
jgi:hypothetical protein